MKKYLTFFLLISSFLFANSSYKSDIIIFSYDRPMQIMSCLESIQYYFKGFDTISVVYRTSNSAFEEGYQIVKNDYPNVNFIKQSVSPNNFRSIVLNILNDTKSNYLMFAVDDNIVKDFVDLEYCSKYIEKYYVHGFFLRLGENTYYSYPNKYYQGFALNSKKIESNIYIWDFNNNHGDWAYPNTVDMTIYRKKYVLNVLSNLNFHDPNTLEGRWASKWPLNNKGLCFSTSKIVNIPLNLVNHSELLNPHMNNFSTQMLLDIFIEGKKINIYSLYKINNISAHMEWEPEFIFK